MIQQYLTSVPLSLSIQPLTMFRKVHYSTFYFFLFHHMEGQKISIRSNFSLTRQEKIMQWLKKNQR